MTASAFAGLLHARKYGKGWRARCPVHRSRPDTLGIVQGDRWVIVKCFAGCRIEDLLPHWGLKMRDLALYDSTPQVRVRTSLQERKENLERQLGLILWLKALENGTQLNRRSDMSYREFDAALSRWKPIVNGVRNAGSA